MTTRVYIVGTDTGAGKTAVTCALLAHARACGLAAVPFKPVASGPMGPKADPERLLRAAGLAPSLLDLVCPLRYADAIAPGIAEHRSHFLAGTDSSPTSSFLERAGEALRGLEIRLAPDFVLIEGAGGLFVPMPGGLWQPQWIRALAPCVLVVGRAELGTINHTCLTTDALRELDLHPRGFVLSETSPLPDPSRSDNAGILAHARHLPHLGTLPHLPDPDAPADPSWARADIWDILQRDPLPLKAPPTELPAT